MSNKHGLASGSDSEQSDSAQSSVKAKRARTTGGSSLPGSSPPPLASKGKRPAPEQEGEKDDAEDEESEEESEGEQRRTQRDLKRARRAEKKAGAIAEAGVIEQVDLTNFMCHDLVTMELGPQINFIVGHNGSGKSAILAGITMALGGNARATDRASSGKGFVKDDRNSAICSVRLSNRGQGAYLPEVYGESITVERKLTREGTGGYYKVKDHTGKVHGKSKAAVEGLTDHFNIQVDNPLTVLTQDSARKFLADSSAKEKYTFFLKGTQLAQLVEEYDTITSSLETTTEIYDRKSLIIPELKLQYKRAKERSNASKAAIGMQGKIDAMALELGWAFADEQEDKIAQGKIYYDRTERHGIKISDQLKKFEIERVEQRAEVGLCETMIAEVSADLEKFEAEKSSIKAEYSKYSAEYSKHLDEQREITNQIKHMEADIRDYDVKIDAEWKRLSAAAGEDQEPIQRKIKELEIETSDHSLAITQMEHKVEQIAEVIDQGREEFLSRQRDVRGIEAEVSDLQQSLQKLRGSKNNELYAFDGAASVRREIDAFRPWKSKPLGPIGSFVKIKPEFQRFAEVIDSFFGLHLNAFVVNNPQDREEMMRIFKKVGMHNGIVISERHDPNFDYSRGEPDPEYLTVSRALEYSNPYIRQVSITSNHIERSILVNERVDGDNVMRNPPRNVESCFTRQMHKVGGIEGGSATVSIQPWKGHPRLSLDIAGAVRIKEEEIAEATRRLRVAEGLLGESNTSQGRLTQEQKQLERTIKMRVNKNVVINNQLERLRNSLKRQDVDSNLDALLQLKESLEKEITSTKDQYQPLKDKLAAMDTISNPLKEQRLALDEKIKKAKKTLIRTQTAVEGPLANLVQLKSSVEQYEVKLKKNENDLEKIRKEIEPYQAEYDEMRKAAEEIGERPVLAKKRDSGKIILERVNLEKLVAEQTKINGATHDELTLELARCKQTATEAIEQVEALSEFIAAIGQAIESRRNRWNQFRTAIASRAKAAFIRNLEHRGFSGKLIFDHVDNLLRIKVQTDSIAGMKKDAKALSGGEKSFSTICLLMTLWEAVGSPIRCLDEFDVFMDALNRRISVEMMVQMALAANEVQYVLITPQSVKSDTFGPGVKVCKMRDPRVEA